MEPLILGALWVLACIVVGLVGRRRSMGFFGVFLLSLVLSPIVMILVLQLTRTPDRDRRDRRPSSSAP
jgi:hypothetical protein